MLNGHLVALGGGKGQNFILSVEHCFIYQSKALNEKNSLKLISKCFDTTWWRKVEKRSKFYFHFRAEYYIDGFFYWDPIFGKTTLAKNTSED